jgi:hypothetical protein
MDEGTRNDLLVKLEELGQRKAASARQLRVHAANIEEVRKALGNPYFYGGRPDDDPESKARFTGYESHEPALRLLREWQEVSQQITTVRQQLRETDSD